jgi:hypothetical protein
MTEELAPNTRVEQTGYGRRGAVIRYETKYRTRWAVVLWDGTQYTERVYPEQIAPAAPVKLSTRELLALSGSAEDGEPDSQDDPDDQEADREQSRHERDLTREW